MTEHSCMQMMVVRTKPRPMTLAAMLAGAMAVLQVCSGCESYRVEHHKRPSFFQRASMGKLPDEVRMADGTVIRYSSFEEKGGGKTARAPGRPPLQIREYHDDGTVTLRCMVPEHVLVNFLECLRNREYELVWDQLLAEHTRQQFLEDGSGMEACVAYLRQNRHDLVATLTRMVAGLAAQETRFDAMGDGRVRCVLRPQHVGKLKYKYFDVAREGIELKLLNMGG